MTEYDLTDLRFKLDDIDNQIIRLLSKRFEVCENVAKFKAENDIEIFQPQREKDMISRKIEVGEKVNLKEDFIRSLFEVIIEESKRKQREVLNIEK